MKDVRETIKDIMMYSNNRESILLGHSLLLAISIMNLEYDVNCTIKDVKTVHKEALEQINQILKGENSER